MTDQGPGYHVDAVMSSTCFHGKNLKEHCEYCVVAPPIPAARLEFLEVDDARTNVARVKEVIGNSIWYKPTKPSRKVPIIPFGIFECINTLNHPP